MSVCSGEESVWFTRDMETASPLRGTVSRVSCVRMNILSVTWRLRLRCAGLRPSVCA